MEHIAGYKTKKQWRLRFLASCIMELLADQDFSEPLSLSVDDKWFWNCFLEKMACVLEHVVWINFFGISCCVLKAEHHVDSFRICVWWHSIYQSGKHQSPMHLNFSSSLGSRPTEPQTSQFCWGRRPWGLLQQFKWMRFSMTVRLKWSSEGYIFFQKKKLAITKCLLVGQFKHEGI